MPDLLCARYFTCGGTCCKSPHASGADARLGIVLITSSLAGQTGKTEKSGLASETRLQGGVASIYAVGQSATAVVKVLTKFFIEALHHTIVSFIAEILLDP